MLIDKFNEEIDNSFSSDWLEKFDYSDANFAQTYISILSKLNDSSKSLINHLHYSILSGEYIQENSFEAKIDLAIEKIDKVTYLQSSASTSLEDHNHNSISLELINNFNKPFKNALRNYKSLVSDVHRSTKDIDPSIFMDLFRTERLDYFSNNYSLQTKGYCEEFIQYNVRLTRIDYRLNTSVEVLRTLVIIHNELENKEDSILKMLYEKCCFLINKILSRQSKVNSYRIDFGSYKELRPDNFKSDIFSCFAEHTLIHDNNSDDTNLQNQGEYRAYISKIREKRKNDTLTYKEFNALIRYYKDINPDGSELEKIISDFEKLEKNAKSSYNKRAYSISYNYLLNNLLSAKIKGSLSLNLEQIEPILSRIETIQEDTRVYNYFPYLRVAQHISSYLNNEFLKPDFKTIIGRDLIDKLSSIIEKVKRNYDWCYKNNFLIYQLPYEECCFPHKMPSGGEVNLFLSSSLILPVNYESEKKQIDKIEQELIKLRTILDIHKSIADDKEEIKNIKLHFDKSDKRNIEILGVFSAIVLFASGSIQLFTYITGITEALRFMLVFGFSLGSFVLLIWIITRESTVDINKIPRIHKWLIGIYILATLIAFINTNNWSFNFDKAKNLNESGKVKKVIDTINLTDKKIVKLIIQDDKKELKDSLTK